MLYIILMKFWKDVNEISSYVFILQTLIEFFHYTLILSFICPLKLKVSQHTE